MTANPSRPITFWLLAFLALCLAALDLQHIGLIDSAIAALRAILHGAGA